MKTLPIRFLLISFSMALLACQSVQESTETELAEGPLSFKDTEEIKAGGYELIKIKKTSYQNTLSCNGTLDVPPQNRAAVSAILGGYVKETNLIIGDYVKKGEVLLRLENPEFAKLQEAYLENQSQLTYLKANYERQKKLAKEKVNTEKGFQQAQSEYDRGLIKKQALAAQLKSIGINPENLVAEDIRSVIALRSPIEGTISDMHINLGSYVEPSHVLMDIVNTEHLHLELEVFEKDISQIEEGQAINFKLTDVSDSLYSGEVHVISNQVNPETRTVKVHGHLTLDENTHFAVGMYVEASIVLSGQEAFSVNQEAIYQAEGKHYLLKSIQNEGNISFQEVYVDLLGEENDSFVFVFKEPQFDIESNYLSGYYFE